jgi:hypothetical protein
MPGLPNVTVPGSNPGDQFDPIIYNLPLAPATGALSATTLITVPQTGTYRVSISASLTTIGTGCSSTPAKFVVSLIFTDPNAASATTVTLATFWTDSGNTYNGTLGPVLLYEAAYGTGFGNIVFRAAAGTAIQISTAVTAAGGSPAPGPAVQLIPIIESLGQ